VAALLAQLDVEPGMRVLEVSASRSTVGISTAGLPTAGLVRDRLGQQADVIRLCEFGDLPRGAAYDRVVVTTPVVSVAHDWVRAVRDGGVVVLPWANPLAGPALVRMVVEDERAAGSFVKLLPWLGETNAAGQSVFEVHKTTIDDGDHTTCDLDPEAVWNDPNALFAIGMRLSDVRCTQQQVPDGGGRFGRWLYDDDSWAGVTVSASGTEPCWTHHGYPNLWRAAEAAYRWWVGNDCPGPERFGMTVAPFGQFGWLGDRYSGRLWRL
jgi:hypothetical protein